MTERPTSLRIRRATRRGLTLIELLLVMVVMGIVMGIGVGSFASLDPGRSTAVEIVRGALRSAVNSAKARRAPAVVRVDSKAGELTPRGLEVVGTWHFESADLTGAFGVKGVSTGARQTPGYLGEAVEFPAGTNARVEFGIQDDPSFEFGEGFAIECLIAPDTATSAHAVSVGHVFGLYVLATGAVRVWFVSVDLEGEPSGQVVLDSDAGELLAGRWSRVRAEYDRRELSLSIDGVRVKQLATNEGVARVQAPLMLGGGQKAFVGRIDELMLSAWETGEPRALPKSVVLEPGAPEQIWFDAAGHLDKLVHPEPIALSLLFDNGRSEVVRVGRWGTVE